MSLLSEIRALPPEVLASRDTVQITSALNQGRTALGLVSCAAMSAWAASNGVRAKVEDHATNPLSTVRSIALAIRDDLTGMSEVGFDFSNPLKVQMLSALVSAGVLTSAQKDEILEMATHPAPVDEFTVRRVCWADDGTWSV